MTIDYGQHTLRKQFNQVTQHNIRVFTDSAEKAAVEQLTETSVPITTTGN